MEVSTMHGMGARWTRVCGIACLLLMAAGGTPAQAVRTYFDPGANFNQYLFYAWLDSKNPAPGYSDRQIRDAIDIQLAWRGMRRLERGRPDLYLVYNTGLKERVSVQGYDYGYVPSAWQWGSDVKYGQPLEGAGTVVVDLVDVKKNALVWRGVASDLISGKSAKQEKKIEKAFEKMFKVFPPRRK